MKTTIAIFFSVFLILPGIKKSARQSVIDGSEMGLYFPSNENLNPINSSLKTFDIHDFNIISDVGGNPKLSIRIDESRWNNSEKEMETDLSIEKWMANPESWIKKSDSETFIDSASFNIPMSDKISQDYDIVIENWMTEPKQWTGNEYINL